MTGRNPSRRTKISVDGIPKKRLLDHFSGIARMDGS